MDAMWLGADSKLFLPLFAKYKQHYLLTIWLIWGINEHLTNYNMLY